MFRKEQFKRKFSTHSYTFGLTETTFLNFKNYVSMCFTIKTDWLKFCILTNCKKENSTK